MEDHLVINIKITVFIPLNPTIPLLHIVSHMHKYYCMAKTIHCSVAYTHKRLEAT